MSEQPTHISLRRNCRNRFPEQVKPSLPKKIFTMDDFTSSTFIDTTTAKIMSQPHIQPPSFPSYTLDDLTRVTSRVDHWFRQIDETVKALKEQVMHKVVASFAEDDRQERATFIKQEMQRCHQQILEHDISRNTDSMLIETLATLMDDYESSFSERPDPSYQLNKEYIAIEQLKKLFKAFRTTVQSWASEMHFNSYVEIEDIKMREYQISNKLPLKEQEKVFPISRQGETVMSAAFNQMRQNYLLLAVNGKESSYYDVVSLKDGKRISSTKWEPCYKQDLISNRLIYSKSINCVVMPRSDIESSYGGGEDAGIDVYRITAKGLRKISFIARSKKDETKMNFELLDNCQAVSIGMFRSVRIVDLFSRKTIASYDIDACVSLGFKYLEKLNLLVFRETIRSISIYRVTHSGTQIHYKYNIPFEARIDNLSKSDNTLAIRFSEGYRESTKEPFKIVEFSASPYTLRTVKSKHQLTLVNNFVVSPQFKTISVSTRYSYMNKKDIGEGLLIWGDKEMLVWIYNGMIKIHYLYDGVLIQEDLTDGSGAENRSEDQTDDGDEDEDNGEDDDDDDQ